MSLTLYRMEDTERVRYQLRERKRQAVWDKAAREEEKEKKQMERLERNRKWRERKNGKKNLMESLQEEKSLNGNEERKEKNKEWRKRRESGTCSFHMSEYGRRTAESLSLAGFLLPLLECPYCQQEMSPPATIYQCKEGHLLCRTCRNMDNMKVRTT